MMSIGETVLVMLGFVGAAALLFGLGEFALDTLEKVLGVNRGDGDEG